MQTFYISAIIKESSPFFELVNKVCGNEVLTFKINAKNEKEAISKMAKTFKKTAAYKEAPTYKKAADQQFYKCQAFWPTSDQEFEELKKITNDDILYEIYVD